MMTNCYNLNCNINKKIYKVVYLAVNDTFNFVEYNTLYNQYKDTIHNLRNSENYEQELEKIKQMYNNLQFNYSGIDKIKYIFVGPYPLDNDNSASSGINSILKKISESRRIEEASIPNLKSYFGESFITEIGDISVDKFKEIIFIPSYILQNDSIFSIKNNIHTYLNKNSSNKECFLPEQQLLMVNLEEDDSSYYKYFNNSSEDDEDDELDENEPINIHISKLYSKIINQKHRLSNSNILKILESIGLIVDNIDIRELFDKESDFNLNLLSLNDFLENKTIRFYVKDLLKKKILSHKFYTTKQINVYLNPILLSNINDKFSESCYIKYIKHLGKYITINNNLKKKILQSFGNINNNTIYLYNFNNIYKSIIRASLGDNSLESVNEILSFYFPNINKDKYSDYISMDCSENLEKFNEKFLLSNKIHYNLEKIKLNDDTYIEVINSSIKYINLQHQLNINTLDLIYVFNNLKLSQEVPFTKIRDFGNTYIYKIFKMITQVKNTNYFPLVSKDILKKWIKYTDIEFYNHTLIDLKSNHKYLVYKLKLFNVKSGGIINGKLFKINNDDTLDIQLENNSIISNIEESFIHGSNIDQLVIGDNISFYNFETIYAQINIFKNGVIEFKTFLRNIFIINVEEYHTKIINKFNTFIDKLKNLPIYKPNIGIFSIPKNILNFNTEFYNTNIVSSSHQFDIKLNSEYNLDFDSAIKLARGFYSYFNVKEEIFVKNQPVKFFNNESWEDAIILELRENGNYNINLTEGNISKDDVDYRYIKSVGNTEYRRFLHFTYNRTSYFNNLPLIKILIRKLLSKDTKDNHGMITQKILDKFEIEAHEAEKIIKQVIEENKNNSINDNYGIDIKIFNLDKTIINGDSVYKILVEGYQNIYQLNQIMEIIKLFLNTYVTIYYIDTDKTSEIFECFKSYIDEKEVINEIENTKEEVDDNFFGDFLAGDDEVDDEVDDDFFGDILEEYDEGSGDEDMEQFLNNENTEDDMRVLNIKKDTSKLVIAKKTKLSGILQKLYDSDSKLFSWGIGEKKTRQMYARACQSQKHPKVITNQKKIEIDQKYPNSYDPSNETLDEKFDPSTLSNNKTYDCDTELSQDIYRNPPNGKGKLKCKSLKHGSSRDNQHWYICPRIWDLIDNVSLNISDLTFETPFTPSKTDFRIHKGDDGDENNGKDISFFQPKFNGRGLIVNKKLNPSMTKSLWIAGESERYQYPGLLKKDTHPLGLSTPCCYETRSFNVEKHFLNDMNDETELAQYWKKIKNRDTNEIYYIKTDPKSNQTSKLTAKEYKAKGFIAPEETYNTYLQKWPKKLDYKPVRIGLLPESLFKYLGMDNANIQTGHIENCDNKGNGIFLRRGIKQSHNTFFSLISDIYGNNYSDKTIINLILEKITLEDFRKLNNGNLEIEFKDNLPTIFSSFQNYLEYTMSDEDKSWVHFAEYLTRPNNWLFKNGLVLIVIEYIYDDLEKYQILCPYFTNFNNNPNAQIVLVLKHGRYYEPIYFFEPPFSSSNFSKTVTIKNILSNPNLFKYKFYKIFYDIYLSNCLNNKKPDPFLVQNLKDNNKISIKNMYLNKSQTLNRVLLYLILFICNNNTEFYPKYLVSDNYNKIVGVILRNHVYVSCYPSKKDININKVTIINWTVFFKQVQFLKSSGKSYKKTDVEKYPWTKSELSKLNTESNEIYDDTLWEWLTDPIQNNIIYFNDDKFDNFKSGNILLDIVTLNKNLNLIERLISERLNNKSNLNISIVRMINNEKSIVVGVQTKSGNIIPIKHIKQKEIPIDINSINIKNIDQIDKELYNYSTFYSDKLFYTKNTINEVIQILSKIKESYLDLDDKYDIKNILSIDNDNTIGILLNCDILIPIKSILNSEALDILDKQYEIINVYNINNYEENIKSYFQLWKFSNYELNIKPFRNVVSSQKMVTKIILQNGQILNLNPTNQFIIHDTNSISEFRLSIIPESEFNIEIGDLKPSIYHSEFVDNRIKFMKQIKYKKTIYMLIKKTLSQYFQNSNIQNIKSFIIDQLENEGKTISQKRKELYLVIEEIFKFLFFGENISENDFNKLEINHINHICKKYKEKKCDTFCILDEHEQEPIDEREIFKSLLTFNINNKNIMNDIDLLKKELKSEEDNLENLKKEFINHNIKLFKEKQYNIDLLKNIKDVIDDIRKQEKVCKLKILSLNYDSVINTSLIKNLMNHFLEEIIRNKFKRTQIFENIQLEFSKEKYTYDNKNEILIRDEDIIANIINSIYQNIKNSFYKNIDIFDYKYKALKVSSFDQQTKNLFTRKSCISKTLNKNIKFIIHKDKKFKNNPKLSNSYNIRLNDGEFQKIKMYLDFENAILNKCTVNSSNSNIQFTKKK